MKKIILTLKKAAMIAAILGVFVIGFVRLAAADCASDCAKCPSGWSCCPTANSHCGCFPMQCPSK